MIILELPKETEQIKILDEIYEINITDFNILTDIKAMPSMINGFVPTTAAYGFHIEQIQIMFERILGSRIIFPKKPDSILCAQS